MKVYLNKHTRERACDSRGQNILSISSEATDISKVVDNSSRRASALVEILRKDKDILRDSYENMTFIDTARLDQIEHFIKHDHNGEGQLIDDHEENNKDVNTADYEEVNGINEHNQQKYKKCNGIVGKDDIENISEFGLSKSSLSSCRMSFGSSQNTPVVDKVLHGNNGFTKDHINPQIDKSSNCKNAFQDDIYGCVIASKVDTIRSLVHIEPTNVEPQNVNDMDYVPSNMTNTDCQAEKCNPLNLDDHQQLDLLINHTISYHESIQIEEVGNYINSVTKDKDDIGNTVHMDKGNISITGEKLVFYGPLKEGVDVHTHDLENQRKPEHVQFELLNEHLEDLNTEKFAEELINFCSKDADVEFPVTKEPVFYGPQNINETFPEFGPPNKNEDQVSFELEDKDENLIQFGPLNIFEALPEFGQLDKNGIDISSELGNNQNEQPVFGPLNIHDVSTFNLETFNDECMQYGPANKNTAISENHYVHNSSIIDKDCLSKYDLHNSPMDTCSEAPLQYGPYNYNETDPWYNPSSQRDPVISCGGDSTLEKIRKECLKSTERGTANTDVVFYGPPNINETIGSFGYDSSGNANLDSMNCALPFENLSYRTPTKTETCTEQACLEDTSVNGKHIWSNESNKVLSAYENHKHLEPFCTHPSICSAEDISKENTSSLAVAKSLVFTAHTDDCVRSTNIPREVVQMRTGSQYSSPKTTPSIDDQDNIPTKPFCDEYATSLPISDPNESVASITDSSPVKIVERFVCEICNTQIVGKTSMQEHLQKHTKFKSFSCQFCSATFTTKSHMTTHSKMCEVLQANHNAQEDKGSVKSFPSNGLDFTCTICNEKFSHKSLMKQHMLIHVDQKLYQCHTCQKVFRHRGTLQTHLRIHTGEKPFSCNFCDKCFLQKSQLNVHVRSTHTGEKPFVCNLCNKGFSDKGHLQRHMFAHSGQKPFSCEICSKGFSQRYQLKKHMQIHSNERHNVCPLCDRSFSSKSSLKKHKCIN